MGDMQMSRVFDGWILRLTHYTQFVVIAKLISLMCRGDNLQEGLSREANLYAVHGWKARVQV